MAVPEHILGYSYPEDYVRARHVEIARLRLRVKELEAELMANQQTRSRYWMRVWRALASAARIRLREFKG